MNKVKTFLLAGTLLLVTAGVFAAKSRFLSAGLVALVGTVYEQVEVGTLGTNMTLIGTTQAQITDQSGFKYELFQFNGSTYAPVYTNIIW